MIKIGAISDCHGKLPDNSQWGLLDLMIIPGDMLVDIRKEESVNIQKEWAEEYFRPWLNKIKTKHIIYVPGNHDLYALQDSHHFNLVFNRKKRDNSTFGIFRPDECLMTKGEYWFHGLNINIYTTPYTLLVNPHKMDYHYCYGKESELELSKEFKNISLGVDILVTHSPPYGILDNGIRDSTGGSIHVGSRALLREVKLKRPKIHIFGHEHYNGGSVLRTEDTIFVNCAKNFVKISL